MSILLTILIVVAAIVLILIVLVQNSKGGGLAANFSSSNQIMGVRKTTDFLEKTTWTLIAAIAVMCVMATSAYIGEGSNTVTEISDEVEAPIQQAPQSAAPTTNFEDAVPAQATPAEPATEETK